MKSAHAGQSLGSLDIAIAVITCCCYVFKMSSNVSCALYIENLALYNAHPNKEHYLNRNLTELLHQEMSPELVADGPLTIHQFVPFYTHNITMIHWITIVILS